MTKLARHLAWLLLCLPCIAIAQQPSPLASIQGTVLDAVTGAPLADAELRLGRVGQPSRLARTDAKGTFSFTDLEPGRYSIMAKRAGYLEQAYGESPESPFRNYSREFQVTAGQSLQGSIRMLREATISGRIYDTNRAPVANARLSLGVLRRLPTGPARLQSPQNISDPNTFAVLTNDRGEYRMTAIPPGEYYVSAASTTNTNGRLQTNNAARTYYPGFRNLEQAIPVKVAAGTNVESIDFSLEPVPTLKVSGRLVNSLLNSAGQEGRDYLYTYTLTPRNPRISDVTGSANTALPDRAPAVDEFEFWNVAPGAYDLYVAYRAGPPDPRGADTHYIGRSIVEVSDRDVTGLTVTIEPGVDIKGQFVLDDAAKALVPNVQSLSVFFQSMNVSQPYSPALGRGNVVQPDGSFVLPHAISGEYLLIPSLNPNLNLYMSSARLGARDITNQVFAVDANSSGPLVIEVSGTAGRIEGAVTDRDNKPAVRARVILVPSLSVLDLTAYKNVLTNAEGRFTLAGIRPGSYTAYAFAEIAEGDWFDPQFMSSHAASGVQINVSRGSQTQRDLKLIPGRAPN